MKATLLPISSAHCDSEPRLIMNSEVPLIAGGDDHHHDDDDDKDDDDHDDYGDLWGRPYFSLYFFEVLVDTPITPIWV